MFLSLLTSNWRAIGLALILAGLAFSWHNYTQLQNEMASLEQTITNQQAKILAQKQALTNWEKSQKQFLARISEQQKARVKAETAKDKTRDKFRKHSLGALARKKPGLIENRLNNGTAAITERLRDCTSGASASCSPSSR